MDCRQNNTIPFIRNRIVTLPSAQGIRLENYICGTLLLLCSDPLSRHRLDAEQSGFTVGKMRDKEKTDSNRPSFLQTVQYPP